MRFSSHVHLVGAVAAVGVLVTVVMLLTPVKANAVWYTATDFIYDKNSCVSIYDCSPDPRVTLRYLQNGTTLQSYSWTGSSGLSAYGWNGTSYPGDVTDSNFGIVAKDPCKPNIGWIPDTSGYNKQHGNNFSNSYKVHSIPNRNVGTVRGFVFPIYQGTYDPGYFAGAYCGDGNDSGTNWDRDWLLLHSEMTSTHGQSSSIESQRWSTIDEMDFLSKGCIKINYMYMVEEGNTNNPGTVEWRWNNRGGYNGLPLTVIGGW